MDPLDRADALLSRAQARGSYVVTPDSAISPMDAANTQQIPRSVVRGADARAVDADATAARDHDGWMDGAISAPARSQFQPEGEPRADE